MTDVRDCVYDFIKRIDELEEENEQLKKFCEEFNALNVSKENEQLKEEVSRESYKVSEAYCFVEELKELLKECRKSFQELSRGYEYSVAGEVSDEMISKIDEVLK